MNKSATELNEKSYDEHSKDWHHAMQNNIGHIFLEKPAIYSLLPKSLEGKSVLCIGVGSGEELNELLDRNPNKIVAIDISQNLLDITSKNYPSVVTIKMDMNNLNFKDGEFDFVYSSLALHYTNDWDKLLSGINKVLKENGQLLFSTHNPLYWKNKPITGITHTNKRGVKLIEHQDILPGNVEIIFNNHKSKDNIDEALNYAGFKIQASIFPKMQKAKTHILKKGDKDNYQKLKLRNEEQPLFYVVKAIKK